MDVGGCYELGEISIKKAARVLDITIRKELELFQDMGIPRDVLGRGDFQIQYHQNPFTTSTSPPPPVHAGWGWTMPVTKP